MDPIMSKGKRAKSGLIRREGINYLKDKFANIWIENMKIVTILFVGRKRTVTGGS